MVSIVGHIGILNSPWSKKSSTIFPPKEKKKADLPLSTRDIFKQ
jgi:hypothetical protein